MTPILVFQWIGVLFGLAVAIAVLSFSLCAAVGLAAACIAKIEHRGEARQRAWLQNKLRSTAWWFSEDSRTMDLLMNLAELSEWDARERWRKFETIPSPPVRGGGENR